MFKRLIGQCCRNTVFYRNNELNIQSNIRRHIATRKRFYRNTGILFNDGKYEITLDQRKLKTPRGSLFQVDNEFLALAIAAEWDSQKDVIKQSMMHLNGLCSTVLDNPNNLTKYDVSQELVNYLDSDTILFSSSEDSELMDLQTKHWTPVIEWFCKRYNVDIASSCDISGPVVTIETKETLKRHILSHNFWAVHGYRFVIEALKSVILGMTVIDKYISVEKAVQLSRLEEEYQSKRWGRVEWAHDLNQQDTQARVAAGVLFVHTNSSTSVIKQKKVEAQT